MKSSHHNIEYFKCVSCNKSFESDFNNGILCRTCTFKANIKIMSDNRDRIDAIINELKNARSTKSSTNNSSN